MDIVINELLAHQKVIEKVLKNMVEDIEKTSNIIVNTVKNGNKILLCGNGGSAGDAQHISAEFTGRFRKERRGLPAIALTTDTSAITAIANDYGYEKIFSRQIEALGKKGDVLIAISTSGNSKNIIEAIKKAKENGLITIALTGRDGGEMRDICDINLIVPSENTARIQEIHIMIGHIFCAKVDNELFYTS